MKNKVTSFANPATLTVTVLIALGLLLGAMAVLGAAAMAVMDVVFTPALVQMSKAFDQALSAGFFDACWQALRTFALTFFQGVLSPHAVILAFAQNWWPAVPAGAGCIPCSLSLFRRSWCGYAGWNNGTHIMTRRRSIKASSAR
jgi:hypothetical protein